MRFVEPNGLVPGVVAEFQVNLAGPVEAPIDSAASRDRFRAVRRSKAWLGMLFGVGALCVGCGNDCDEVADLIRECCAKGPPELRAECEAEAKRVEEDPDANACENVKSKLAGCKS